MKNNQKVEKSKRSIYLFNFDIPVESFNNHYI